MMDSIAVEGFSKPVGKEIVISVLEMFRDGFSVELIAEACSVSGRKVRAIVQTSIPKEWQEEARKSMRQPGW